MSRVLWSLLALVVGLLIVSMVGAKVIELAVGLVLVFVMLWGLRAVVGPRER